MKGIKSIKRIILFSTTLVLLAGVLGGCGAGKEMSSVWQENSITIDGNFTDWDSNLLQLPEKNTTLGFKNNNEYLYLCLITGDRFKIRQLIRAGFIIWFESEKGNNAIFGIKYPLANTTSEPLQFSDISRGGMERGNPDLIINNLIEKQTELQIVNKDKYPLTALPIQSKDGIEAKLGYHSNQFVYELKIPLATNKKYPFEIDAVPGDVVKIKFETEELNREERGTNRTPMGGGGGRPPGGGTTPGIGGQRPGGGMGPGMFQKMEPLDLTVSLQLVKPTKQ